MNNILLTCGFCGYESTADEFDLDKFGQGFWCNDCDGYTYYSDIDNVKHKFLLILEDKSTENSIYFKAPIPLNKRLSPLRYPGGKSKLIEYLYSKLQKTNIDTFGEAFCGGSSVGLSLLEAGVIKNLILNDLDYGVFSLFSIIKENPDMLIDKIKNYEPTHKDFFKSREIITNNYSNCDLFEAAWALLVVNRLAYSGIYKANPLGGRNGSKKDLLSRWSPNTICKRIEKINLMKDRITVLNMDACELIEEMYWNPFTTIFIDPPYYVKGKDLYYCYFNEEQHVKLNTLLDSLYKGCPGADILLTYDNAKFIEDLYLYPEIEKINRVYTI
ncbi:DNA adenine methylase [Alkaliphilus sp. B6464]|uniref:DNA adenine methylase n=1 Tax=Alkaliphilus sp. B6464 TaxID=2731219 RepID=UPI001BA78FCF|nr:DNA adenine methylase [Alkaliphilus sp. B6464]QUH21844.1 DNA adenine methylase [Alkaliphilus sp. B6464]